MLNSLSGIFTIIFSAIPSITSLRSAELEHFKLTSKCNKGNASESTLHSSILV